MPDYESFEEEEIYIFRKEINSDMFLGYLAQTKTIKSDANIKSSTSKTINSDCEIGWRRTIDSNYHLKKLSIPKLIYSNAIIKKLGYEGSINSDAYIKKIDNTKTINFNAWIEEIQSQTINSNNYIKRNYGNHALVTDDDMVSLYHMDEPNWSGVPDEVIDSKGTNDGSAMALTTTTPLGLYNNAGIFSGTNTGINLGNDSSFHTDIFSISVWVYPTAASNDYNDIVNSSRYRLTLRSTRFVQWWVNVSGVGWITAISDSAITLNKWALLTVTYDGTTAKLYVNGALQSTAGSGAGTIAWTGNTVYVGQSGGDTNEYIGRMDDLAFWNVAMGQVGISSIWKEFTRIYSNAYVTKTYSKTLNSNIQIVKAGTKTINSDAYLKATSTVTINSNTYIRKLGYEGSLNSNSYILKATSKTINSNAQLTRLGIPVTISSNYYIKYLGYSKTINSNAFIKKLATSKTINSNANIVMAYTGTIYSNYYIKKLAASKTITSDSFIKKLANTETINGNAYLQGVPSNTINSNYIIKKLAYEGSIDSDSYIKKLAIEETITSDSWVGEVQSATIDSDYHIKKLGISKTITSSTYLEGPYTQAINSDSFIKKLATTKTIASDSFIKKLAAEKTINCDGYIGLRTSKTINSNAYIKGVVSNTINSNCQLKAYDVTVSIYCNYHIVRVLTKTIYSSLIIRQPAATQPWVCAARYINKPIIVSANSLSYSETIAQSYHPRKTLTSDYVIS